MKLLEDLREASLQNFLFSEEYVCTNEAFQVFGRSLLLCKRTLLISQFRSLSIYSGAYLQVYVRENILNDVL